MLEVLRYFLSVAALILKYSEAVPAIDVWVTASVRIFVIYSYAGKNPKEKQTTQPPTAH